MTEMPEYKPETGTFGDYAPPSVEEIANSISHPVLTKLNQRLEVLINENSDLTQKHAELYSRVQVLDVEKSRLRDKYRTAEYAVTSVLKELLDDEEISSENAQRIADIFDSVVLTKQIEIEYTITATATVEVPYGADEDDVANSTYIERVEFYTDFDGADVLESDHDVEDWKVRS